MCLLAGCQSSETFSNKTAEAWTIADKNTRVAGEQLVAIETARQIVVENLANADTTAYKRLRCDFVDGKARVVPDMEQGAMNNTNRPFDLAISGLGFFVVKSAQGTFYTRNGNLFVNSQNDVVLGIGEGEYKLHPRIAIPVNTTEIMISQSGNVKVLLAGEVLKREIGQIQLALILDPTNLKPVKPGIYELGEKSPQPVMAMPQENGAGALMQSFLEGSNVQIDREKLRDEYLRKWRDSLTQVAAK